MAKSKKALYLLEGLAKIKEVQGWTYEDIRQKLNTHLPENAQIPDSASGRNQIERWLKHERHGWVEPRADIILAIDALVELNDYLLRK